MLKTHLGLSHDPDLEGAPKGWELPISDTLCYKGAGFLVPVAGVIKLMPGTCSDPAFRRIDVDVNTGKVKGLFQRNPSRSLNCSDQSPLVQNRSPLFCNARL
jgi:formate--tetrahydrofolate ligase